MMKGGGSAARALPPLRSARRELAATQASEAASCKASPEVRRPCAQPWARGWAGQRRWCATSAASAGTGLSGATAQGLAGRGLAGRGGGWARGQRARRRRGGLDARGGRARPPVHPEPRGHPPRARHGLDRTAGGAAANLGLLRRSLLRLLGLRLPSLGRRWLRWSLRARLCGLLDRLFGRRKHELSRQPPRPSGRGARRGAGCRRGRAQAGCPRAPRPFAAAAWGAARSGARGTKRISQCFK